MRFRFLSDKVGEGDNLLLREGNPGLLPGLLALEEPGHILAQDAHDLHSLQVLFDLLRVGAVDHVPVSGGNNGHLHQAEIFVQLIPSGGGARPPGGDDSGGGLEKETVPAAAEVGIEARSRKEVMAPVAPPQWTGLPNTKPSKSPAMSRNSFTLSSKTHVFF